MIQDPNAPLLSELRWFVGQRWRAGIIVTLGAVVSMLWIEWSHNLFEILAAGITILLYNSAFSILFRQSPRWLEFPMAQRSVAWVQILLDLFCLTSLSIFTNGLFSPLIGLFVLHMIFASLLLQPPKYMGYIGWITAIIMMTWGLWATDQLPRTTIENFVAMGWIGTLFMTVYITSHITNNVRANHDRTRAVLDSVTDGVLTIDQTGTIEMANPEALGMFHYKSSHIAGKQINTLIATINMPKLLEDNAALDAVVFHDVPDIFGTRRDGSTFPVEYSIRRMTLNEKEAFVVVVRDITEHRETEATLRNLNEELRKHQEQQIQQEKMVAVGTMAAGVAHEIANPLANMDGLIQLVERNPDRMKPELSNQLRDQVARITQIVRQLKDFAHPIESDRSVVAADELVQSALDLLRFDKRHHIINAQHSTLNPCCQVHVHPQSIQQVLLNLIVNALDATADLPKPCVEIHSKCLGDCSACSISVSDNGAGISPEDLERIFEPFFTTKPLGQGTGLGLSISYNLVHRDGGWIEVESEVGKGTTISIRLPHTKHTP